jgi:hypothetical protein
MTMNKHISFFPILLLLAGTVCAQDGKTYSYGTGRAGSGKQSAQDVEDIGEISESGGASKWRFNVNASGQYTSNAFLSGNYGSEDFVFLPAFTVGYTTALNKHFTLDFEVKLESALFADHSDRSFTGYSSTITLDYLYKPGLPRVYARLQPYRYDGWDSGDLATEALGFIGGADWSKGFNAGRSVVYAGVSYSYFLSDPSIDNLSQFRAVVGLAHQIRSNLTGQLYYVYTYGDYTDYDRNDSRNAVSGNLIYQFSENVFGSITASWIGNDSTQEHGSYKNFATGIGLTLQY